MIAPAWSILRALACVSITLLSVADTPKMWLQYLACSSCSVSAASQISFHVRLEKRHRAVRGGRPFCLVESLGLVGVSVTLLVVVDSPKVWMYCLLDHSCCPLVVSLYYSLSA